MYVLLMSKWEGVMRRPSGRRRWHVASCAGTVIWASVCEDLATASLVGSHSSASSGITSRAKRYSAAFIFAGSIPGGTPKPISSVKGSR